MIICVQCLYSISKSSTWSIFWPVHKSFKSYTCSLTLVNKTKCNLVHNVSGRCLLLRIILCDVIFNTFTLGGLLWSCWYFCMMLYSVSPLATKVSVNTITRSVTIGVKAYSPYNSDQYRVFELRKLDNKDVQVWFVVLFFSTVVRWWLKFCPFHVTI